MITGTLTKITSQKKLMIKVNKETFDSIQSQAENLAIKTNLVDARYPTWAPVPSEEQLEPGYFIIIKLDRYDVNNLVKFERLVKKPVRINGILKSYDFVPEDKRMCGINYQLTTINVISKPASDSLTS